jgi:hypothetical protein
MWYSSSFDVFYCVHYMVVYCVLHGGLLCTTWWSIVYYMVVYCVLHGGILCTTWWSIVYYMVVYCVLHGGLYKHGPNFKCAVFSQTNARRRICVDKLNVWWCQWEIGQFKSLQFVEFVDLTWYKLEIWWFSYEWSCIA